jgi:steroid 5-alpha reductase family enzyme
MVNYDFLNYLPKNELFDLIMVMILVLSVLCWILSVINDNYSQVDRLWSIAPVLYAWTITGYTIYKLKDYNARLIVATILLTLWGVRLTYNFYRKGGYLSGGEDYRWPFVRQYVNPILFQIFNVFFISFYQNVLLFLMASPAYVIYLNRNNTELNVLDFLAATLFVICLMGETVADEQQWRFQNLKRKLLKEKKETLGFLTYGLFKYSRHPNYFFELSLWWVFYLFSVASDSKLNWFNYSIFGTVLLTLLFQGSTWLTELISLRKYPDYAKYQQNVSRIIPWFSREWTKTN